ncbi:amidohydrolase [Colletotrichum plurivorum]|uniref:Amidohydrolase n=1 Tax=Colletotrichum plurivorum TaxID=2175906 RepID=A0A8H6JG82_9PEZI|nr:amidohydrolase [Colletotrichum plurivorum]
MTRILIQNVRVFDSRVVREPSNVVITRSAGNIQDPMNDGSAADASDIIVDGQGCTLIPGLIDAYVNIKGATAAIGAFAAHGVTTVVDLSSNTQQCQALRVFAAGKTRLPTFLTSGNQAASARDYYEPQVNDNPNETVVSTAEEAAAFVASRATGPERADFIKVAVDVHSPTDALLKALVDAAHAYGKLAVVRTAGKASYARAMRAGFDIFAHAPLDEPLDVELAREMAARDKVVVPTLLMMRNRASGGTGSPGGIQRDGSGPGAMNRGSYDNAVQSVRVLHGAGVTICAGTTANLEPGASIPFGESLHEEMRLLAGAGMPLLDVLRSATCVAATALRLSDRGIVRAGLRADLLLVEGNPLEDIGAVRRIRKVWIQGEDVEPEHGR